MLFNEQLFIFYNIFNKSQINSTVKTGRKLLFEAKEDDLAAIKPSAYTPLVLRYLHTLSAVLFYVLGSSFFLAYVFLRNGIMADASSTWLTAGDMPLLLAGLLYGGLSIEKSIRNDAGASTPIMLGIGIPALVLLVLTLVLNFR